MNILPPLSGLVIYPDKGSRILENIAALVPDYMAAYTRRQLWLSSNLSTDTASEYIGAVNEFL